MSTIGIMAIGMTMVLVAGGLDLSVGSILAVGAVLTARLMTYQGLHPWLAVLCGLGAGYVGPVPMPVIIMLLLVGLAAAFLANTVLGRQIYAVGSNPRAARLSGI